MEDKEIILAQIDEIIKQYEDVKIALENDEDLNSDQKDLLQRFDIF